MTRDFGNRRGLTLVEIPIALLILAIAIVIGMRTFAAVGTVQRDSRLVNQASAYAAAKLSEFSAYPRSRLETGSDQVVSPGGMSFQRSWVVTPSAQSSIVEITVAWTFGGRADSIKLGTVL
jgi:prepilin-type N-terminal cleavage/methylation domain-containing protein